MVTNIPWEEWDSAQKEYYTRKRPEGSFTWREIVEKMGYKTTSHGRKMVQQLVRDGFLVKTRVGQKSYYTPVVPSGRANTKRNTDRGPKG